LIVDDHPLVRAALKSLLGTERDLDVVGEAGDTASALKVCNEQRPDIVVLDLQLGPEDGLEVLAQLAEVAPTTAPVVLTAHASVFYALRCYAAGASAFLSKSSPASEIVNALRRVADGKRYIPPEYAEEIASYYLENPKGAGDPLASLTDRELQVMRGITQGSSNRELASMLGISVRTVETHRGNLLRKLKLRNNADLTRIALANGLG
jgi:DNA-binding NarL/FixJ family response regulator